MLASECKFSETNDRLCIGFVTIMSRQGPDSTKVIITESIQTMDFGTVSLISLLQKEIYDA